MPSNGSDHAPVIGLSTTVEVARWGAWDRPAALLPQSYVDAVAAAGGLPVLLPPLDTGAAEVLSRVDGLILTGGPDVDPARYAADAHAETGAPRTARDGWELELCRLALERDVPLLAICRGAQILNVALGGTLHQHLPERVGHDGHRPAPGTMGRTDVTLEPASLAGTVLGPAVTVLCSHHQALDRVADGISVVGRSADGTVEAVEVTGRRWAVGVQWHPEDDATDRRIFAALIAAARAASLAGGRRT